MRPLHVDWVFRQNQISASAPPPSPQQPPPTPIHQRAVYFLNSALIADFLSVFMAAFIGHQKDAWLLTSLAANTCFPAVHSLYMLGKQVSF